MNSVRWFLLMAMCMFGACQVHQKKEVIIEPVKEIAFHVGYPVVHKHSGTYFHKPDQTEYIYFGDVITNKCIDIFTFAGEKKWHIPLNYVARLSDIDDFSIHSPDTIIVLGSHTNQIYFLNQKGECWKTMKIDSLVIPPKGVHYEYASSIYQDFCSDDNLIFKCYAEPDTSTHLPIDFVSRIRYRYRLYYSAPLLLKIENIFTTHPDALFGIQKFYYGLTDSTHLISELPYYYHFNSSIAVFSLYSNRIFIFDQQNLNLTNDIKISSSHTQIGAEPIPIDKIHATKIQEMVNLNERTAGIINRFFYDQYRNLFYVIVYHEVPENSSVENGGTDRAWSLIVLDKNFNQLQENEFSGHQFSSGYTIVCKQGILISNNYTDKENYDPAIAKFELFKISLN